MAPRSVALVGASRREGSVGCRMVETLARGGYGGVVHCVNPRYGEVGGHPCLPSLADLPAAPDVAVLSVAAHRVERTFRDALDAGARSLIVFDPCFFEGDTDPPLLDRLKGIARESGVPVCGGNGMGVVNLDAGAWLSFQGPHLPLRGGVAAVCHSGSVYSLLIDSNRRHRFNLLVSPGQEIGATAADYIDYALTVPTTRVICAFLEAVRDPDGFVAALARAREKGIPVVIDKVARTETSAALAATHSAAVAGSDTAFGAVCETHGAIRCADLDEMMATAQILDHDRRPGPGGLGVVTDSGGLREQLVDLADDLGVPFAPLTPATVESLRETLAYGLAPVNPLDAAGPLSGDFLEKFDAASLAVANDPNVAIVAHELFVDDNFAFYPEVVDALEDMPAKTGKQHVLFCSLGAVENREIARRFRDLGIPVVNGARLLLIAMRNVLRWRDRRASMDDDPEPADPVAVERWRARLRAGLLDETDALAMLRDFGVPAVASVVCRSREAAVRAARDIGFPVALKTAADGIGHKSDVDGIRVGLGDADQVASAWDDLRDRLGPRVAVAAMASGGVELAFGAVRDEQFGPVVMAAAGGVLVELLDDRAFALAPFGRDRARRTIESLKVSKLLKGARGGPAADVERLADALARFSVLAAALTDEVAEMDVNPIVAGPDGALAVDALVVAGQAPPWRAADPPPY